MIARRLYAGLICVTWQFIASSVFAVEPVKQTKARPLVTDPVGLGDYLQMFLGLAFVLALIVGMAWLIRRMGSIQHMGHGVLKVVAGLSVGQRERIVLLQVGETQLLVGLAPGQIRTLHVLDKPVPTDTAQLKQSVSFSERLQSAMKGKLG